jgi:hypothetical protein
MQSFPKVESKDKDRATTGTRTSVLIGQTIVVSAPLRHGFFEEMFENQSFIHISARLQGTSTKLRL